MNYLLRRCTWNIQISPLTKITKPMPASYLFTFISACWEYTCQLFLRYKREIFIPGVLGFLKTTRSFPKIAKGVRSLPKKSEVFRSLPKTSEVFRSLRTRVNASSLPVLFTSKIRDHEEGIVIYSTIYSSFTWFSFFTWVWVNIFLEIVSSKMETTHSFQSGVSRREIEVFNPQG